MIAKRQANVKRKLNGKSAMLRNTTFFQLKGEIVLATEIQQTLRINININFFLRDSAISLTCFKHRFNTDRKETRTHNKR